MEIGDQIVVPLQALMGALDSPDVGPAAKRRALNALEGCPSETTVKGGVAERLVLTQVYRRRRNRMQPGDPLAEATDELVVALEGATEIEIVLVCTVATRDSLVYLFTDMDVSRLLGCVVGEASKSSGYRPNG